MDDNAVKLNLKATNAEITRMGDSINVRVYESTDANMQLDETSLKQFNYAAHLTVNNIGAAITQLNPQKQLIPGRAKPSSFSSYTERQHTGAVGSQVVPSKPVARAAGGSYIADTARSSFTGYNISVQNKATAEPQNGAVAAAARNVSRTSSNKITYQILRGVDWVEGYFSEGQEITVYANLNKISIVVAMKELTVRTGQPAEKFKVESETQM